MEEQVELIEFMKEKRFKDKLSKYSEFRGCKYLSIDNLWF